MQAALIPPFAHLETIRDRKYHLLLTHLFDQPDIRYREFYKSLKVHNSAAFIILDNSAHEHVVGESIQKVLSLGQSLNADEIVIPDSLFDSSDTIDRAKGSFEYLLSPGGASLFKTFSPRLMVVPQGRSFKDLSRCSFNLSLLVREFRKTFDERHKRLPEITFGVSKDYEIFRGGLYRVVKEIILPSAESFKADVHILGWGHNLWGHREIAEDFGDRIRSTDSAKPFVYGYHEIRLNSHYLDIPTYPKRPEEYFEKEFSGAQFAASMRNVEVFDATCRGEVVV